MHLLILIFLDQCFTWFFQIHCSKFKPLNLLIISMAHFIVSRIHDFYFVLNYRNSQSEPQFVRTKKICENLDLWIYVKNMACIFFQEQFLQNKILGYKTDLHSGHVDNVALKITFRRQPFEKNRWNLSGENIFVRNFDG